MISSIVLTEYSGTSGMTVAAARRTAATVAVVDNLDRTSSALGMPHPMRSLR